MSFPFDKFAKTIFRFRSKRIVSGSFRQTLPPKFPMFPLRVALISAGCLFAVASLYAETVLVSEKFADGSRSGNHPPESLEWHCSVAGRFLQDGQGVMKINGAADSARHAVAHFVMPERAVTLEPEESLVLSFDFKPTAGGVPSGNSLRFGLFNSANEAENLLQGDGQNPTGASAAGYVGALTMKSETATVISIMERNGQGALLTNSHAYKTLENTPASFGLQMGETYGVKLTVKRTSGDTVELGIEISGGGLSTPFTMAYEDAAEPVFTFDTIGFSIFKSVVDAEFSNIQLVKGS